MSQCQRGRLVLKIIPMILTLDWQCKQVQPIKISIVDKNISCCSLSYYKSEGDVMHYIKIKTMCYRCALTCLFKNQSVLKGLADLHSLKCSGDTSVLDASNCLMLSARCFGESSDCSLELFRTTLDGHWLGWWHDMIQHRAKWAIRECLMIHSPLFFLCCKEQIVKCNR